MKRSPKKERKNDCDGQLLLKDSKEESIERDALSLNLVLEFMYLHSSNFIAHKREFFLHNII